MTAQISAVVAVLAAILSGVQLLLMRTTLRGTILTEAAQLFWNPSNRDDRIAISDLADKPFAQWTPEDRERGRRVAIQISQISLLLRHSYADREAFLDYWASNCVHYYRILAPLIEEQRKHSDTDEGVYFEWLARKALVHSRKTQWWQQRRYLKLKQATAELPEIG